MDTDGPDANKQALGFIYLWRSLADNPIWQNPELLKVWLWCLFRASWRTRWASIKTGRGTTEVLVERGQFVCGRKAAARELGMKPSSFRNRLVRLQKSGNVDIKGDSHYSLITVCHYERYQNSTPSQGQDEGQAKDRQRTGKGQAKDTKNKENTLSPSDKGKNNPPQPPRKRGASRHKAEKDDAPKPGRHRDPHADAFAAAFLEQFGETYEWSKADFVQLTKWRKTHSAVTPAEFAALAQTCWGRGEYTPQASLTIKGLCAGWQKLTTQRSLWEAGKAAAREDPDAGRAALYPDGPK